MTTTSTNTYYVRFSDVRILRYILIACGVSKELRRGTAKWLLREERRVRDELRSISTVQRMSHLNQSRKRLRDQMLKIESMTQNTVQSLMNFVLLPSDPSEALTDLKKKLCKMKDVRSPATTKLKLNVVTRVVDAAMCAVSFFSTFTSRKSEKTVKDYLEFSLWLSPRKGSEHYDTGLYFQALLRGDTKGSFKDLVADGGRYDNLIRKYTRFGSSKVGAVGVRFYIDKIVENKLDRWYNEEKKRREIVSQMKYGRLRKSSTRVLVCDANGIGCANESLEERMRIAAEIRLNGIGAEYVVIIFCSLVVSLSYLTPPTRTHTHTHTNSQIHISLTIWSGGCVRVLP